MANGLKEFDILRQQVGQRTRAAGQEAQQATKRRFARIGALGSGAFIKAQERTQQAAAEQGERSQQSIDLAEAQERKRQEETAVERQFRERQQSFAEKTQEEQAATQREQFEKTFLAQQDQFAKQFNLTKEQAEIDRKIKEQQLQQSADQFELDKRTQIFNQFSAAGFDPRFLQRFLALFDSTGEIPSAQEISESLAGTDNVTAQKRQEIEKRLAGRF